MSMKFHIMFVALSTVTIVSAWAKQPDEYYHFTQLDMRKAWEITLGSPEIKIALISTGVNYQLPELVETIARNPGESGNGFENDGIDNDQNGYIDDVFGANTLLKVGNPMDYNGVGTFEASLVHRQS